MIKYCTNNKDYSTYKLDTDTMTVKSVKYSSDYFSTIFIEEDGLFVVEGKEPIEVKAGQILIKLYPADGSYRDKEFIALTDPKLLDYYVRKKKANDAKNEANIIQGCEDPIGVSCDCQ